MLRPSPSIYNALIRTHHITSRKKIAKLRKAANKHTSYVLIRSGGSPGLMYVEGSEEGVTKWVSNVRALKYKDYQCVRKPLLLDDAIQGTVIKADNEGFEELESVADFADKMSSFGLLSWWRTAMGYEGSDHKIGGIG